MYAEITAAYSSAKIALEIARAANGLSNYNELVSAVSEVSTKLMDATVIALGAQEKQSSMAAEIDELKKTIVRLENWNSERQKYRRAEIASGVFAYVQNEVVGNFQSAHKYCCSCFEGGITSTLQTIQINDKAFGNGFDLVCHKKCPNVRFSHFKRL